MLTRVTITGADDRVDPEQLVALSVEYPFAEWGVLFSQKRAGTPRYPTHDWREKLCQAVRGTGTKLSAHVCGAWKNDTWTLPDLDPAFARMQLNGFDGQQGWAIAAMVTHDSYQFIYQARDLEALDRAVVFAAECPRGRVEALFDPSAGRGITTTVWPRPGSRPIPIGFAGGISHRNVESVLADIGKGDAPYWIDMETGVRSDDNVFDVSLAHHVLRLAAPFVEKA